MNNLGKFQIAVGSTTGTKGSIIINDDDVHQSSNSSDYSDNDNDNVIFDDLYLKSNTN